MPIACHLLFAMKHMVAFSLPRVVFFSHRIVIPNALILNIKYGASTDDSIARMWNNQAVGRNFVDQLAAQELQRKKTNKRSKTSADMEYEMNFSTHAW